MNTFIAVIVVAGLGTGAYFLFRRFRAKVDALAREVRRRVNG